MQIDFDRESLFKYISMAHAPFSFNITLLIAYANIEEIYKLVLLHFEEEVYC